MKNDFYKIFIWGVGIDYDNYLNNIRYEQSKGNIEVVAVVSNETYFTKIDGYNVIKKTDIKNYDYDYIIIASINKYNEIVNEALSIGIVREKLLNVTIFNVYNFDFKRYIHLYTSNISIISNNCWGGITYHSLGMEFLSPFINMHECEDDYLKLLSNLEFYLQQPLVFEKEMYEPNLKRNFPVVLLGDIRLYFNHYITFEEAKTKWLQRLQRINPNNLLIVFYTTNIKSAELFDKLPFERKIVFVPFKCNISSAIELDAFQDTLSKQCNNEFWRIVNSLAHSKYKYYDVIKLLSGDLDYKRII